MREVSTRAASVPTARSVEDDGPVWPTRTIHHPLTYVTVNAERLHHDLPHEPHGARYEERLVELLDVGIARDQLERVFDPFYTTKEVGE